MGPFGDGSGGGVPWDVAWDVARAVVETYTGHSALRTVKKKSIPTTVTVGMTLGQYTSHERVTLQRIHAEQRPEQIRYGEERERESESEKTENSVSRGWIQYGCSRGWIRFRGPR